MTTEEIRKLINKYEAGRATLQEEQALRDYFQQEDISDEFQPVANQFHYFEKLSEVEPTESKDGFAKIDFEEMGSQKDNRPGKTTTSIMTWTLRIAAGIALLVIGFAGGHFLNIGKQASANEQINPKIRRMKAALFSPFSESQPSASGRLAAINITDKIPVNNKNLARQASQVLIHTMNNDDNVNVRLAAAEALYKYRKDVPIKPALIHSLTRQTDPFMQITLINMLVKLKAKDAIPVMQELLAFAGTQDIVSNHLKIGIAKLTML